MTKANNTVLKTLFGTIGILILFSATILETRINKLINDKLSGLIFVLLAIIIVIY